MKKNKVPLALKIIPWLYPKFEAIVPSLAHKYFIHLFYTPFHYKEPEKEKELVKTSHRFSLTVNNKRIQCYRWGTMGPKILLIHGWAGRAGQFRGIIPALLARGYQCVAFDGPAHGRSEGKQTELVDFADVINKVVEHENGVEAIIAHSFGGVATFFALSRGLHVPKLINISSPTIAEQVILNFRRALNASEKSGLAFRKHLVDTYGFTFEEVSTLHLITLVKNLQLLLIQDEDDKEVVPENAIELKKIYPAAEVYFTKGLGHTRILRDDAVISRVLDFLQK